MKPNFEAIPVDRTAGPLAAQGFRSRVDWNQVDAAALVPNTGRERRSASVALGAICSC